VIVLGILPPRARQKLAKLQAMRDDARALLNAMGERRRAIDDRLQVAVHNLTVSDPRDAVSRSRLQAEVAAAQDAVNDIDRAQRARQSALYAAEHALPPIEQWLRNNSDGPVDLSGGSNFIDVVLDPATLMGDGETFEARVARIRREIYRLTAEAQTIRNAPLPPAEIKAALTRAVDRLAEQGTPTLDLNAGRAAITWPDAHAYAPGAPPLSATKLVAWLFRDELVAAVTEGIDEMAPGLPLAGRDQRISEITRRVRVLELQEETLIDAAAGDGTTIDRRGGLPVEVILMIHPKVLADELVVRPGAPGAPPPPSLEAPVAPSAMAAE
jgi:hypothetical protein